MMDDVLPDVVSVDVLRSLRAGDIVLVTLQAGVEDAEVALVQEVLSDLVVEDVHLIVTRAGYIDQFHKMSLAELWSLRGAIDDAIDTVAKYRPVAEEV